MQVNDLRSPKKLILVCLALFILLVYFGQDKTIQPVDLHGFVVGVQEQDGELKAVAVESDGERFVVKIPNQYLLKAPLPVLKENQEVDLMVTGFKVLKQGVTCDFVSLVKAGPVPEDSTPKKDAPLPVDDLKPSLGIKGM